ncbi:MAG: hypothetical protein JKX68_00260 [Flavobacteriales bacterium]|nr:hypothetical protein [Flavobacteriales bacterium]
MIKKQINLTIREQEITIYITEGFTSIQIAKKLLISRRTVEKHRENIMFKLKVKNMAQLINSVIKMDLLG